MFIVVLIAALLAPTDAVREQKFETECTDKTGGSLTAIFDRGSCLIAKSTTNAFADAKVDCNDFGTRFQGHLVHVIDQERVDKMKTGFSMAIGNSFHVGLGQDTDTSATGGWFYIDENNAFTYPAQITSNLWKSGNPDDAAAANCAMLKYESALIGVKLDDDDCTVARKYICEYFDGIKIDYRQTAFDKKGQGDSIISQETLSSQADCGKKCATVKPCFSFAYGSVDKNCMLMYNTDNAVDASDYKLYARI